MSTYQLAKEFKCSQTAIRYHLRKAKLKTTKTAFCKAPPLVGANRRTCAVCKNIIASGKNHNTCPSCRVKLRRYRMKLAAVKLLGNKCNRCGWAGPIAGYDFHHNQGDKDFNISNPANKSWKLVLAELAKCELLCACCHRIEHSNLPEGFITLAMDYTGKLDLS